MAAEQRIVVVAPGANRRWGPRRAAVAIVDIAHDDAPPLRLPLGNFAYDGLLDKLDQVRDDIAAREHISRCADRDEEFVSA